MNVRAFMAMAGLLSIAGSLAVVLATGSHSGFRSSELHVALLTAEAFIGLLAAFLLFGRLSRRRRLDDLLLASALLFLGSTNLLFAAGPVILGEQGSAFASWSAHLGRMTGASLLAAGALAPARIVSLSARRVGLLAAGYVAAFIAIAALGLILSDVPLQLRNGALLGGLDALGAADPLATVLWAQVLLLVLVAAIGAARKAGRSGDRLLGGIAVACVFSLAARIEYLIWPAASPEHVYIGDGLRLAFWLTILAAVVWEIEMASRQAAAVATHEERRRIARALHDGLAQDIASVQRNLKWLDEDDPFVRRALSSADRAASGARRAIAALTDAPDRPLAERLTDLAVMLREREGVEIELALDSVARPEPATSEALLLIASEAVTNAARHSSARSVLVSLEGTTRLRLTVSDDGVGFDPRRVGAGRGRSYGLLGMRERAQSVGARLSVVTQPGHGTRVEVVL